MRHTIESYRKKLLALPIEIALISYEMKSEELNKKIALTLCSEIRRKQIFYKKTLKVSHSNNRIKRIQGTHPTQVNNKMR